MKKSLLYLGFSASLAFSVCESGYAQVGVKGIPPGIETNFSVDELRIIDIPVEKSLAVLKQQAALAKENDGKPPKIAEAIQTELDLAANGEWSVSPDGKHICRMRVRSEGALGLIMGYSRFDLPEGTMLYVYNGDKKQVLGAYTSQTNPRKGSFATEVLAGDEAIFEYITPDRALYPKVTINRIGYCFDNLTVAYIKDDGEPDVSTEIGESGYCMVNINCSEGDDWQVQKKGVAKMLMYITGNGYDAGWYLCTGSLINNTSQDFTPYFLSAYHCYEGANDANDLPQWIFYFDYESPGCTNSTPVNTRTLVGCELRSHIPIYNGSDGLLIELTEELPVEWNLYINGWDRRATVLSGNGVGIHHPSGDVKKISSFSNYSISTWPGVDTGAYQAHWLIYFIRTTNGFGQTEGGSSGSPIFASNKLIIGTLTGGNSSCYYTSGSNYYGRLWYHWDQYGSTPTTQMKTWLDPLNTGVETLEGIYYDPSLLEVPTVSYDLVDPVFSVSAPGIRSEGKRVDLTSAFLTEDIHVATTAQIGRASCRERVLRLV